MTVSLTQMMRPVNQMMVDAEANSFFGRGSALIADRRRMPAKTSLPYLKMNWPRAATHLSFYNRMGGAGLL